MDTERFNLLVNVLKIIEKQKTPTNVQSLIEIVDRYNTELTSDQKSLVLTEILSFVKGDHIKHENFIEAEERMTQTTKPDYFF